MTIGELCRRVSYLLNRRRFERQLEEEMASHRAMMRNPRRFGNPLKLREASRDAWGWGWLDRGIQDLRHAARVLRGAPGFTITAVLILSAGIGLNLTFFHVLNVVALQPPAVADPATLVRFERRSPTFSSNGVPYPATQFIRAHNSVFSAVLTRSSSSIIWEDAADSRLPAAFVSANWFGELGYAAALGRVFTEELDERSDAPPAIVVSHELWRTRIGADPQVIGRRVRVNGRVATVVGVAPATFPDLELQQPRLWLLIHQIDQFEPGSTLKTDWAAHSTALYGRLRRGVTPSAAQDGLKPTTLELARMHPKEFHPDERYEPATGAQNFRHARDREELWMIASLVGALTLLVLVVASANLGNLVLSHAIGRLREFSVRSALGASRWRILRHIVVECGIVAALGAAAGTGVGYAAARWFATTTEMPAYLDFTPDWRLWAAAFATAFVAMLAFGFVPAWMVSRRDLIAAMKDGGQQTSAGLARARFRLALVAAQVGGCCALLIVAASLTRGLQRLLAADVGFSFDRVAVLDVPLDRHGVRGDQARAYWAAVSHTIADHPDVEATAFAYPAPAGDMMSESTYNDAPSLRIASVRVDPGFFALLDIPLLAGRTFGPSDDDSAVIISRRVAETMYGTLDVLGRRYPRTATGTTKTIIGIAAEAQIGRRRGDLGGTEYRPLARGDYGGAALVVRSRVSPATLIQPLRRAAVAQDARVVPAVTIVAREYELALRAPRLVSAIAGGIATLVLTLACLGIFGIVSYAARVRTKEIGIRRALGADSPRIIGALLGQLVWPLAIGIAAGSGLGVAASRLLGGKPFYFAVNEPAAPVAALAIFATAALAAALIPAVRALRTDPLHALRHE